MNKKFVKPEFEFVKIEKNEVILTSQTEYDPDGILAKDPDTDWDWGE